MIRVTDDIALEDRELEERFTRSSGPGGQNVNKVSTAVELRFDIRRSPSLPGDMKRRLERLGGSRVTSEGVLVIRAERFRTQERNREDARDRLLGLIRKAAVVPKRRIATKPPKGSRLLRLEGKAKRGTVKRLRRAGPDAD